MTNRGGGNTLSELQAMIRQFVDEREWDQFHNPKDLAISLSLEASELLEHFQWKNGEEMVQHAKNGKEEIGEEIADVLWYTLLLANKLDVDVANTFKKKLAKNAVKYPVEKARNNHKKYTEHIK